MKDFYQIKEALRERIRELHRIAPGSIGDQMQYEVLDGEEGVYKMRCRTFDWMRNGPGTLHGGMCATIVDQAMGFVAHCVKRWSITLNLPVPKGRNSIQRTVCPKSNFPCFRRYC